MAEWFRTMWSRCRAVVRRGRLDREFDEELTTHLELLMDEYRRDGLSPIEARRAAVRKLGRPELLRETHREQRGIPLLDVVRQDLRYAVRVLSKTPIFTAVVTGSLALGIGANTALFSLADDLLLRSLSVHDPDRLVQVQQTAEVIGIRKVGSAFPAQAFEHVRAQTQMFDGVLGFNQLDRPVVDIDGVTVPDARVERVSENYFRDLGVTPVVGRAPEASDSDVAVISERMWRARFGRNPSVLGRTLTVDGRSCTIVGVAPPRFTGLQVENLVDIWMTSRTPGLLQMIARLEPGVAAEQARAAAEVLFAQLAQAQPAVFSWNDRMRIALRPAGKGLSGLRGQYERPLLALTCLVTLVLLITCANIGNLLMVRNGARRRELAVRASLGAGRSRLVLQYLIESAVLAAIGGLLALLVARWGVSILLSMLPLQAVPAGLAFHADGRILAFTASLSLVAALLFGLVPAWRATEVDLPDTLRSSQKTTPNRKSRRTGRVLVASQVGLSVLLLVGAGLFVRTVRNLAHVDVGFNPDGLLQVVLDSTGSGYRQGQIGPLYRLLLERVSALPGVRSVAGARNPVMRGMLSRTSFRSLGPDRMVPPGEAWDSIEVGPSFFETMHISLVRGRTFTAADFERGETLVIVSETFARHYFGTDDPTVGPTGSMIVGVVRDAKLSSLRRENGPMMYSLARPPEANRLDALEIRVAGDVDAVARAVQAEVRRIHPRLLVAISTMQQEIDRSMARERMVAATSAFFGVLGLLLVSIGIFGVASYTVAQRTSELGIRMALGASAWAVVRESLRETALMLGVGLAAGTIAAVAAVRLTAGLISDLLFGLTASDAANIAGAALVMIGIGLAACILPARRAIRIDPLAAIRHE